MADINSFLEHLTDNGFDVHVEGDRAYVTSEFEPERISFSIEDFSSMLSSLAYERWELIDEDRGDEEASRFAYEVFSEPGITLKDAAARCGDEEIDVQIDRVYDIPVEGSNETQSGYHVVIMDKSRDEVGWRTVAETDIPAGENGEVNLVEAIKDYLELSPEQAEKYENRVDFEDSFFDSVKEWGEDNGLTLDNLDAYLTADPDAGFSIEVHDFFDDDGLYDGSQYDILDQDGTVIYSASDDLSDSFGILCDAVEKISGNEKNSDFKECLNAFAESAEGEFEPDVDIDGETVLDLEGLENAMMNAAEEGIGNEIADSADQNDSIYSIDTDNTNSKDDINPNDSLDAVDPGDDTAIEDDEDFEDFGLNDWAD